MIYVEPRAVNRRWETCPAETKPARWRSLYASINVQGAITITQFTHLTLGAPEAYILLFERARQTIGLKPARAGEKNAYPAVEFGRHGGRRIRGYRLLHEFGITVFETKRFHQCMLDQSGILILDLQNTVTAVRAKRRRPRP